MLLLLLACAPEPAPDPAPAWTVLAEGLPEAAYSVFAERRSDLYVLGADRGDGPLLLRYRGEAWSRLEVDAEGSLWWGWRDDNVSLLAGERGLLLRHSNHFGDFEALPSPEFATLYGVWGQGSGSALAVGSLGGEGLLIEEENDWSATPLPLQTPALYKAWGDERRRLVVGAEGALLEDALVGDGGGWRAVDLGTTEPLFTVSGDDDAAYAVGGEVVGQIFRNAHGDGLSEVWLEEAPPALPRLYGVAARPGCDPVAVGLLGTALLRRGEAWEPLDPPTSLDLHAAWLDEGCGLWAVGGALGSEREGVLLYYGVDAPEPLGSPDWVSEGERPGEAPGEHVLFIEARCEDGRWRYAAETSAEVTELTLQLAHGAAEAVEVHPMAALAQNPQRLWPRFELGLDVGDYSPGASTVYACEAAGAMTWAWRASDGAGELECVRSGVTLPEVFEGCLPWGEGGE